MSKTILITGASRGIGAATAQCAAARGYRVCVNFRKDEAAAQQIVERILAGGGDAFSWQADVSQEDEILKMFARIDQRFGRLDALVNNAGIGAQYARLTEISLARLRNIFEINVFGAMLCTREAVKRMSTLHGGTGGAIVNISSVAARFGSPGEYVDYAATKGALDTFSIGLAKEVAREGIRVNSIRPGFIETEIHLQSGVPDRLEKKRHLVPMNRPGQPAEVAEAVLWLLSDEASYVSGTVMEVAGGL